MKEEWKVLSKLFNNYEVSNLGNVRCKQPDGSYKDVKCTYYNYHGVKQKRFYATSDVQDDVDTFFYVAETVMRTFSKHKIQRNQTVIFIDGDPSNCSLENLKLYTCDKIKWGSTFPATAVIVYQKDKSGNVIPGSEKHFYSQIQAAEYLRISKSTVRTCAMTGKEVTVLRGNIVLGRYYIRLAVPHDDKTTDVC